jgi:hypothetical protein
MLLDWQAIKMKYPHWSDETCQERYTKIKDRLDEFTLQAAWKALDSLLDDPDTVEIYVRIEE